MTESRRDLDSVADVLRSAGLLTEARGPGDVALHGVCQDSRAVRAGDLFLAWKGVDRDGHDYIEDAVRGGAVAVVVERPVDVTIPQLVVSNGRRAAALAATEVVGRASDRLFTVGITGTNGKSTTALIVRHLLEQRGPAAAMGTLGLVDSEGVRPGTEGLTTPGPVQVAVWLWELAEGGMEAVVMEASSHALDQHRVDGIEFDVGVFTNLSRDHLDYHRDFAGYLGAKSRLVQLVSAEGTVVVNRDDRSWDELDGDGRTVRTFAIDTDADVRAENLATGPSGSSFDLVLAGERVRVELPLLGRYNVENALAAAATASAAGLGISQIAEGLRTVPQVSGRLEAVMTDPYTVLIDFAHTPDALEGALSAVRSLTSGRLIVLFGAGGDRDATKRRPMAEAVARFADVVILTSDNPRTEDPEKILDDLAEGLQGRDFERMVDRRAAICHALDIARAGDTVVLAGKGHETYQVIGTEKRPFDERVIVGECVDARGAA